MMKFNKLEDKINEVFSSIELDENEDKGLICIAYKINSKNKEITAIQNIRVNRLDAVEVLIMMLRDKKELEIQNLFEAVQEYI